MTFSLTFNFFANARGITFEDGGGVTWAFNKNTNQISATASGSGGPSAANPTAEVGLSVVNGSAATFMRSDAAPPLDQTISPTMTGNWIFTGTVAAQNGLNVSNAPLVVAAQSISAGSYIYSATLAVPGFILDSNGSDYGYVANIDSHTWALGFNTSKAALGTSALTWSDGGVVNVVGGMADFELNGTALQAIAPTWTGAHTFTPGSAVTAVKINAAANQIGLAVVGSGSGFAVEVASGASAPGVYIDNTAQGAGTPALRIDSSATTGAHTATFTATNKPGSATTSPDTWLPISVNGTTHYIPCFL